MGWGLEEFVRESNRIEGIIRDPTLAELDATVAFLRLDEPRITDLQAFVAAVAPGHKLRDKPGMNVRVGDHIAPPGGPVTRKQLQAILDLAIAGKDSWGVHNAYETLHPFTDGNGRSGRALWLWQVKCAPLGFLHTYYYQTLSNSHGRVAQSPDR